jgi:hypothetical protein
MTLYNPITKLLLCVATLLIGCGAPMQDSYTEGAPDTSYVLIDSTIASSQEISYQEGATVQRADSVVSKLELPEISTENNIQKVVVIDTLPIYNKDSMFAQKKRHYEIQNNKVKRINDTVKSIDEKFKMIEEKIKTYRK